MTHLVELLQVRVDRGEDDDLVALEVILLLGQPAQVVHHFQIGHCAVKVSILGVDPRGVYVKHVVSVFGLVLGVVFGHVRVVIVIDHVVNVHVVAADRVLEGLVEAGEVERLFAAHAIKLALLARAQQRILEPVHLEHGIQTAHELGVVEQRTNAIKRRNVPVVHGLEEREHDYGAHVEQLQVIDHVLA